MASFFPAAGCVYSPTGSGSGAYALTGLQSGVPILIQGATLNDTDIVLPTVCLNGLRLVYAFGRDFGEVGVNGMALLGEGGKGQVDTLKSYVDGRRTSSSGSAVYLSTPVGGYRIFVIGFGLGMPDSDYQIQPFVIYGKISS